ncbi:MAG: DUF115 domain-containing protein, partial [bacterium]|nr:DUF115 domain-containing protein [bacterium]
MADLKKINPLPFLKWTGSRILWHSQVLFTHLGLYHKCDLSRLKSFKDIHRGKTAFLVGSGPSVRLEDLEKLGDPITFCFNRFHLAYESLTFRPTYTVTADLGMIRDFGAEIIEKSEGTVFVASQTRPGLPGEFTWLNIKITAPPLSFSKKIYHHAALGGSSLMIAIQLGYYMGIKNFILYGVDHNFNYTIVDPPPENRYIAATGDDNHFIKNYRSGKPWCQPNIQMIEKTFLWADRYLR